MQIKIQVQTVGKVQNHQEWQRVILIPIIRAQRVNHLVQEKETHQKSNS